MCRSLCFAPLCKNKQTHLVGKYLFPFLCGRTFTSLLFIKDVDLHEVGADVLAASEDRHVVLYEAGLLLLPAAVSQLFNFSWTASSQLIYGL